MLGKPTPPKKRLTRKISVEYVKFTPEEMAYDKPAAESETWIPVGRGWAAFRRYVKWKRQMARLDPDVRKAFPDDKSVNQVLRAAMKGMK